MCCHFYNESVSTSPGFFTKPPAGSERAKRRNVMLDLANKNQLNALSEMVLNVMKQKRAHSTENHSKIKTL